MGCGGKKERGDLEEPLYAKSGWWTWIWGSAQICSACELDKHSQNHAMDYRCSLTYNGIMSW